MGFTEWHKYRDSDTTSRLSLKYNPEYKSILTQSNALGLVWPVAYAGKLSIWCCCVTVITESVHWLVLLLHYILAFAIILKYPFLAQCPLLSKNYRCDGGLNCIDCKDYVLVRDTYKVLPLQQKSDYWPTPQVFFRLAKLTMALCIELKSDWDKAGKIQSVIK